MTGALRVAKSHGIEIWQGIEFEKRGKETSIKILIRWRKLKKFSENLKWLLKN